MEVVNVVTPLTIERFTGNRRGQQAWAPPGQALSAAMKGFTRTLPRLEDFYPQRAVRNPKSRVES